MSEEKKAKLNAVDVINDIRGLIVDLPEESRYPQLTGFVEGVMKVIDEYDKGVEEDKVRIKHLNETQASDKVLNAVAIKYGLTLNQVAGYLDMAEQLNNTNLEGTGLVVVPFWFHQQYNDLKDMNEALNVETENLMATLSRAHKAAPNIIDMPKRSSIITGNTQPYIPGETGPRIGDEHLDSGFDSHLLGN